MTVGAVGTVSHFKSKQAARAAANAIALASDLGDDAVALTSDGRDATRINRWPAPSKAIQTYLSQDMSEGSIAWVIDTSKSVAPYYSTLSRLTNIAVMNLQPGAQRFGVVLAAADGPRIRHVQLASRDAYQRTKELIDAGAPNGDADLAAAFSSAARERPDKIFLVAGQQIDAEVAAEMRRQAKAVGTIVNVIVLGDDQKPLQRLARATSGDYKVLDSRALETWATLIAQNGTLHKLEKEYFER